MEQFFTKLGLQWENWMLGSDFLIPRALISPRAQKAKNSSPKSNGKGSFLSNSRWGIFFLCILEALTAAGADFPSIKLIPWPFSFVWQMAGGGKNRKCDFPPENGAARGDF